MRVHLVTDRFELGGGIEHIYQVAKGLSDIRFTIFGESGPAIERFKNLENVEIHDPGYRPGEVMKNNPDLVHIHHLRPLAAFYKNPFKTYQVPIIYTAHGLHIHKYEFYNTFQANINYFLRFHLEKKILRKANKVIAVSREDKTFLENDYHLKNVTYLTNGIEFSRITGNIDESRVDLRRRLGLPVDEFLFVTVARFDFQKGYDILIHAISKIKDLLDRNEAKCRFIFVGDGEEFERMKALSVKRSVSRYIRFIGARNEGYEYIKAGDVCLLPSRWEGLPIVLLETGLLKTPALASDTYGNREIIRETNGILFKNQDIDALARTLRGVFLEHGKYNLPGFAENLYREVLENYSLEKMLSGLRSIYSGFYS